MNRYETMHNNKPKLIWDIRLGYSCNSDCLFCVAATSRNLPDRTTKEVKHELRTGIQHNAKRVLFLGGELTIRPDIIEIVQYARDVGFKEIMLPSNGRMFSNKNFTDEIINAGLTELWISIHSHIEEIADYLSQRQGSFKETVQGIKNVLDYDVYLGTNTLITKQNYQSLPEIVDFLADLGVSREQLRSMRPVGNAYKNFYLVCPRLKEISPFVCRALELGIKRGLKMDVEAYPRCFVRGYEHCIFEMPPMEIRDIGYIREGRYMAYNREGDSIRKRDRRKGPYCHECKYDSICLGIWKQYVELRPDELYDLNPVY